MGASVDKACNCGRSAPVVDKALAPASEKQPLTDGEQDPPRKKEPEKQFYGGSAFGYYSEDPYKGATVGEDYHSSCREKCCNICCGLLCILSIAFITLCMVWPLTLDDATTTWGQYLDQPPAQAVNATVELLKRAEHIAINLTSSNVTIPPALDLVCSGGGMLSWYFLGVHQVLDYLQGFSKTHVYRMAGASGGADVAFRTAIMSTPQKVAEQSLAFGVLQQEYKDKFANPLFAVLSADHMWRHLGRWILQNNTNLSRISGTAFTSVTVLKPWPTNVLVSSYTSSSQAYKAFTSTGSIFLAPDAIEKGEMDYDGKLSMDGGASDCEPHFKDGLREQLIVTLGGLDMSNEDTMKWISGMYDLEGAVALIQKGQDDFAAFLRGGQKTPTLEIVDERSDWTAFDCYGGAVSDTQMVIYQVSFCVLTVLGCIVSCCCCRCWWFRCCDVSPDYKHIDYSKY
jgi:hypothetical protein